MRDFWHFQIPGFTKREKTCYQKKFRPFNKLIIKKNQKKTSL